MHHFTPPIRPEHNIADISEEMREKAFKHTTAVLRKLDEVRRAAELPIEHMPIVIKMYGKVVLAMIAEAEREELAKRTKRLPMTMRSEDRERQPLKVKPGKPFEVVARPQFLAFRPEDFAIHGNRSHWMVHDILIGNRSQFIGKRGPAPGSEFGPGGILEHMKLETAQTAMDLTFVVEYVGPDPEGEVFEATVIGSAVEF